MTSTAPDHWPGPPEAVLLDVGGVLLLPDPKALGHALDTARVSHDPAALPMAHYGGVRSLDRAPDAWAVGGAPTGYLAGILTSIGVPEPERDTAAAALHAVFSRPAIEIWCQMAPTARAGLELLGARRTPTAIVSNADGSVERQLALHGLAQTGVGPGLSVAAIVDSAVVGVAKPDPAVFRPALDALRLPPERCAYIGDTVTYDIVGARAAGLRPVHLDPWRACPDDDHPHATDLLQAVTVVLA